LAVVVEPATGGTFAEGEEGELALTSVGREAFAVLR